MSDVLVADVLAPDVKIVQEATRRAFSGKLKDSQIDEFLKSVTSAGVGVPSPIKAKGSVYFGLVYGIVSCEPLDERYKLYKFDESAWGIGAVAGSGAGVMYTAYENWDAFFKLTTAYHAQGIAEGGGILQINWFNGSGIPIGQFNGVVGGIGAFECGGSGKWKR